MFFSAGAADTVTHLFQGQRATVDGTDGPIFIERLTCHIKLKRRLVRGNMSLYLALCYAMNPLTWTAPCSRRDGCVDHADPGSAPETAALAYTSRRTASLGFGRCRF